MRKLLKFQKAFRRKKENNKNNLNHTITERSVGTEDLNYKMKHLGQISRSEI